jgi:DNA-binding transcriptional regulator YdaS (Cro superfamily)
MTLAQYLDDKGNTAVALGRRLGVAHSTVVRWAANRVPAERVRAVADATGIPPHELRPDIFPPPVTPADHAAPVAGGANHDAAREAGR